MKTLISLAAFAAISLLPVFAEGECRVRAIVSQAGAVPPEIHVHNAAGTATAGKLQVKTFLNHEFTLLAPKGGPVVFTSKADPASVKTPEDVIGEGELPAKAASIILLFFPDAPDKPHCRVTVVDATAKAFPPGSFKVVNLSRSPIRIELEKDKFEFQPGETKVIKNAPMGDNGSAGMRAYYESEGTWKPFSESMWANPGDKRVLQIIADNVATHQPEMTGIRDVAKP